MATVIQILRAGGSFSLEPDAARSREVGQQAQATQWPVESGASITDHTVVLPMRVTVDCTFSPAPILATSPPAGPGRPQQAWAILLSALEGRQSCRVETPDNVYEDLVITSLQSPETAETGYSREITIEFQQVRKVSSQEAAIPASQVVSRLRHASSTVDKGQAQTGTAQAAQVAATVLTITLPGGATSAAAIDGVTRLLGANSTDAVAVGG